MKLKVQAAAPRISTPPATSSIARVDWSRATMSMPRAIRIGPPVPASELAAMATATSTMRFQCGLK